MQGDRVGGRATQVVESGQVVVLSRWNGRSRYGYSSSKVDLSLPILEHLKSRMVVRPN